MGAKRSKQSLMVATAIAFISEKTVSYVPILERWFKAIAPASYERRKKSISGTTCYLLGVLSLPFPRPRIGTGYSHGYYRRCLGSLVGKRWGKLKWFEGKTLEGSLACLAGALLGSFIYGLMVPEAQIPWLILLWGGLVTLFTEGIFRFELDNLLVAPVSAAIMTAVIWIAYFF